MNLLSWINTTHIAIAFILSLIYCIWKLGMLLASKNDRDIKVVSYLFSLSFVITHIIGLWGASIGAFSKKGEFKGDEGSMIHNLLKFMLDLNTDIKIFTTILSIVLLPQIISYFLSGLFGCAAAPLFVGASLRIFVWSIIKSLTIASGILLSVAIFGHIQDWDGWDLKGTTSLLSLTFLLILLSFSVLYLYRDINSSLGQAPNDRTPTLRKKLRAIKNWLTRNSTTTQPQTKQ